MPEIILFPQLQTQFAMWEQKELPIRAYKLPSFSNCSLDENSIELLKNTNQFQIEVYIRN